MKITELTAENLENAKTGDIIVTPNKDEYKIEQVFNGVWLFKNGKNVYRDYADNYVWSAKENTNAARLHFMYEILAHWANRNFNW